MIEIACRRTGSRVIASPTMQGWMQGEVDRGWQDKSADGCRAHVVGWVDILVNSGDGRAGARATNLKDFNDRSAVARATIIRGRS